MEEGVKQTQHFKRPPQEVWDYLTKPELLEQWLAKTDFEPVAGHKFRFNSPYGNDSICEVKEIKPFSKLSYSWQKNSASDDKPFNSQVEWTLTPTENGTELQLEHNGFTVLEDLIAHKNGWDTCLHMLANVLK